MKIEIYQVLHIMLNEQSEEKFQEFLVNFKKYETTEPRFYSYFEEHYTTRTGKIDYIYT